MPRLNPHYLSIVVLTASSFVSGVARAQAVVPALITDNLTFRAGFGMQHDSNFFRAPSATAVSEQITTQSIGLNLNIPVSLQRFEFDVEMTNNQYRDYDTFDYIGKAYSAAWRWSFTPQLHGNVSSVRTESLNTPSDSLVSTLRNRNSTTTNGFDAVYEMGGPWQILAGYARVTSLNERPLIGEANERSNTYSVGARYAMASGNSLTYNLRREDGNNAIDYTGQIHDFSGVWLVSGNTTVNGRLAYITRDYATASQFDYNGVGGAVNVVWRATGKVTVNAGWTRDLASYQTAGSTHTLTDTVSVGPVWQISPITSLSAQYSHAIRRDKGTVLGVSNSRKDTTNNTSLVYRWQPRPFVTLSASLTHAQRSSNLAGIDYSDNLVSLLAQLRF